MDRDREPTQGPHGPGQGLGKRSMPSGAEFAGIGLQFGLTIVVFVFAGVWLDRKLGTSPWLTIGGTFLGAAGGGYSMYRRAVQAQRRDGRGPR
jgi:ATP synthase protein I